MTTDRTHEPSAAAHGMARLSIPDTNTPDRERKRQSLAEMVAENARRPVSLGIEVPNPEDPDRELIAELCEALVAAKRELWERDRHMWNLSDFKNFAVVQQIDAILSKARGAAG